jgi:dienelactone hydrolase
MRGHFLARLIAVGALLALASPGYRSSTLKASGRQDARPAVSAIDAPVGTDTQSVRWVKVAAPGVGVMLAAVARPQGAGPFPTVIILHGSHGFAQQYVQVARAMARGGVLGVSACWFTGGRGAGSRFVTPIECPDAPAMSDASSPVALQAVDAIVQAIRTLPDVRPDRMALFGHSRGGGATLNYILLGAATVRAAVLNSAGYPAELAKRAPEINVPILMLHGTADSPADGGSAFTNVQMARDFEAALRRAGRPVEAKYYEGGTHNGLFASATQYDDEMQRVMAFLRRCLVD